MLKSDKCIQSPSSDTSPKLTSSRSYDSAAVPNEWSFVSNEVNSITTLTEARLCSNFIGSLPPVVMLISFEHRIEVGALVGCLNVVLVMYLPLHIPLESSQATPQHL